MVVSQASSSISSTVFDPSISSLAAEISFLVFSVTLGNSTVVALPVVLSVRDLKERAVT